MTSYDNVGLTGLISRRKLNRPISDLVSYYQELEPLSATYPATIHVLRLMAENNLHYSFKEIKTYCKSSYYVAMGGNPDWREGKGYFMTLSVFTRDCLKYGSNKKITFKNTSVTPKSIANLHINTTQKSIIGIDNLNPISFHVQNEKQGNLLVDGVQND
jgi:hypothetical protein